MNKDFCYECRKIKFYCPHMTVKEVKYVPGTKNTKYTGAFLNESGGEATNAQGVVGIKTKKLPRASKPGPGGK